MNELDLRPGVGRFGATARLFHLVDEMPRDKQLILLKQLRGECAATAKPRSYSLAMSRVYRVSA